VPCLNNYIALPLCNFATLPLCNYDIWMNILQAKNLTKMYTIGERQIAVLNNISITVEAGEFVAIMYSLVSIIPAQVMFL